MHAVPSEHCHGIEFFRQPDLKSLDPEPYFACIAALRPLFAQPQFASATPGFYLNYITVPDDGGNCLRLTYYTVAPRETQPAIQEFVNQRPGGLAIFQSEWTLRADANQPLASFEGEELRFRNFLATNTRIVLDLLESYGSAPLQERVRRYRHVDLAQRIAPEASLGPVFLQFSATLREMDAQAKPEYWRSLVHLFSGRDFGLHFLVNMLAVEEAPYDRRFFEPDWVSANLL